MIIACGNVILPRKITGRGSAPPLRMLSVYFRKKGTEPQNTRPTRPMRPDFSRNPRPSAAHEL